MDEMILRSKWARGILSRIIVHELEKKGISETSLAINELSLKTNEDGTIGLHLSVDASVRPDTITNLLKI